MCLFRRFLCCLGMGLFSAVISSGLLLFITVAIFIVLMPPEESIHWTWTITPPEIVSSISIISMIIYWMILGEENLPPTP